jgi:hypothetical protein
MPYKKMSTNSLILAMVAVSRNYAGRNSQMRARFASISHSHPIKKTGLLATPIVAQSSTAYLPKFWESDCIVVNVGHAS